MHQPVNKIISRYSLILSAVWNLDFLAEVTSFIPPFCISQKLWDSDVLLLNFIAVLSPLFLLVVTYVLIELHAQGFKVIVYCWKPFHPCFVRIRRNWSSSDSIIHAFASLIFLSFASLNYNAYQLLSSTSIYIANSTSPLMTYVVFDHKDMHVDTPRYIIPLLLLFFLGVLPSLLLLLYPIRMFRVRLQRCCTHRWLIRLNAFVETFQGPFKDGCNGTRDYRIIPGILGCVILLLNTFSCLIHGSNCDNYLIVTFALVFAFSSVLSAYIKPCKSSCANLSLTFHLMMMVSATIILTLWRQDLDMDKTVLVSLFTVVVAIPHIVMFLWVCYKIQKKFGLRQRFLMWFSFTTG